MIYLMVTGQAVPTKLMELKKVLVNEAFPMLEKQGVKILGSWQTVVGNLEEFNNLYAYDSMDHYEKVMKKIAGDPTWWKTYAKGRALVDSETTKFLSPLISTELTK